MTEYTLWLLSQSTEFQSGYDAYESSQSPRGHSKEWVRGYSQAAADFARTESARYA